MHKNIFQIFQLFVSIIVGSGFLCDIRDGRNLECDFISTAEVVQFTCYNL